MTLLKVSSKGWVVIPAHLRKKYGIKTRAQVVIEPRREGILLKSSENIIHRYRGIAKHGPGTLELIRERRLEIKHEKP